MTMPHASEFKGPPIQRDVDKVCRAIVNRGRSPQYHSTQLRNLRENWPALATALRDLLEQQGRPVPPEWRTK